MSIINPAEQIPVKVKVSTTIRDGSQKETFELTTFGKYYKKDHASFLQYDEEIEEGKIKTTVKVSEDETLILRTGAVKMRMLFQVNKKLEGRYESLYGVMAMSTRTNRLLHTFNEASNTGSVDLLYDLNMQGAHAGTYHMEITFEEEK